LRLPPEIALQDSSDDLSPQNTPSPVSRHKFQRTQPRLPSPQIRRIPPQDPVDIASLGIADPSNDTMDWTPSQHTSFSPTYPENTYSRDNSLFAAGRGTLPPAPGTTFTAPPAKDQSVNWFKTAPKAADPFVSRPGSRDSDSPKYKDIQFREQRFFPQQVYPTTC
jgi:hypothetical protein